MPAVCGHFCIFLHLHLGTGGREGRMAASAPRTFVSLGAGASVEVVEDFGPALDNGASFTNAVLEVRT